MSYFADVTVKFRRCSHFKFVCHYLPASAVMWETGVLFLCVCTSCNDWSWSRQQRSCKYLLSTVATWVQYAPHKVICTWPILPATLATPRTRSLFYYIIMFCVVYCVLGVLCTLCVAYCANCFQLFARTQVCCYKQYLLAQPQKSEWKVTLQITRFILMLTWLPIIQERTDSMFYFCNWMIGSVELKHVVNDWQFYGSVNNEISCAIKAKAIPL